MSILNRPSDGLFNVLIILYKILAEYGPLSREDIRCLTTPGNVDSQQVSQTLTRWTQLGLFYENKDKFSIAKECAPGKGQNLSDAVSLLPGQLRTLIFTKKNNEDFWSTTASADFTRGISWLLSQDVYSFNTKNYKEVEHAEISQVTDHTKRVLQNDTRWSGLSQWAIYLGFAWDGNPLVIDPSVAIRESLPSVFSVAQKLKASSFFKSLAECLPVVDFGEYRKNLESVLDLQKWRKPPNMMLSTSLSRGLKRLELSGDIKFDYLADSGEAYRFMRQNDEEWGSAFNHVVWQKSEVR